MMMEISGVIGLFGKNLPEFLPAAESRTVDRKHFLGGASMSTRIASSF
jgi:hypothetical protein